LPRYDFKVPWFDAANANVVSQRLTLLECPSNWVEPRVYTATDAGFAGQSPNPDTTFTVASTTTSPSPVLRRRHR
jgi:hypothetical protein